MLRKIPIAAAVLALAASNARAQCIEEIPEIIWSLPADGAVDVPANAKLWFLPSNPGDTLDILVDGVPASTTPVFWMFDPGLMVPGPHTVVVLANARGDPEPREVARLSFESTAETLPTPTDRPDSTLVRRAAQRDMTEVCQAAVAAIDCFDQGQDTHFVAEAPNAEGYVVTASDGEGTVFQRLLWPGECSHPEALLAANLRPCIELARIGYDGVSPNGAIRCEAPENCSSAGANMPIGCLLVAGVLLRAFRRR